METAQPESFPQLTEEQCVALLDKIEEYFSQPDVTSAVGTFLNEESKNFAFFVTSEDVRIHQNIALFQRYGTLIEKLMDNFCTANAVDLGTVATACMWELERCEVQDVASSYICVGYIAGGITIEKFEGLVEDTNAILNYDTRDHMQPGEDSEEGEEEKEEEGDEDEQ